jgi:hypothetical protein
MDAGCCVVSSTQNLTIEPQEAHLKAVPVRDLFLLRRVKSVVPHTLENIGTSELRVIAVELKKDQKSR